MLALPTLCGLPRPISASASYLTKSTRMETALTALLPKSGTLSLMPVAAIRILSLSTRMELATNAPKAKNTTMMVHAINAPKKIPIVLNAKPS